MSTESGWRLIDVESVTPRPNHQLLPETEEPPSPGAPPSGVSAVPAAGEQSPASESNACSAVAEASTPIEGVGIKRVLVLVPGPSAALAEEHLDRWQESLGATWVVRRFHTALAPDGETAATCLAQYLDSLQRQVADKDKAIVIVGLGEGAVVAARALAEERAAATVEHLAGVIAVASDVSSEAPLLPETVPVTVVSALLALRSEMALLRSLIRAGIITLGCTGVLLAAILRLGRVLRPQGSVERSF